MNNLLKGSLGIPIGVSVGRRRKLPISTIAIIVVNTIIYFITSFENALLVVGDYWVSLGGFIPSLMALQFQWYRVFTSMFLHADFFHIFFNMYFLYIFGRAVEDSLGRVRFLALYILSGVIASVFHTAFSFLGGPAAYVVPAIGASGAISGILGAYLILYPGTSLVMGWSFFFFPFFFRMKAVYYLLFWFAVQILYGYTRVAGSTAVFAHAGGFIAGIALLPFVADRKRIAELRYTRYITILQYLVFTPVKKAGLGSLTKVVVLILLASVLAGAAYSLTDLSGLGVIKMATLQYVCEEVPYIDYLGFQLPDVKNAISSVSLDTTRVLLNRLYAAGLLYDNTKASKEVTLSNEVLRLPVKITPTRIVYVDTTIWRFEGAYDEEGFLSIGRGELVTQVVIMREYWPIDTYYYEQAAYVFTISSLSVNLSRIKWHTALVTVFTTSVAIIVALWKDRDLTLVGE
ncbi:MAG: rhomboid family intramembrane serine protease [Thermoproteota archaeon]